MTKDIKMNPNIKAVKMYHSQHSVEELLKDVYQQEEKWTQRKGLQQENDKEIDKKIDNLASLCPQCKKYLWEWILSLLTEDTW